MDRPERMTRALDEGKLGASPVQIAAQFLGLVHGDRLVLGPMKDERGNLKPSCGRARVVGFPVGLQVFQVRGSDPEHLAGSLVDDLCVAPLPPGFFLFRIDTVEGDFRRGDVIQVRNGAGKVLGCGRARYDHLEARATLGQRDQKPLIHYDYLYLIN